MAGKKADDAKGSKGKAAKAGKPSSSSSGGKGKKKKWSKGKMKEKVNNLVLFDKATYDKLISEVNGSLARRGIKELMAKGLIRLVADHSAQSIYTRATNA
eukprot:tig00000037_g10072.t1